MTSSEVATQPHDLGRAIEVRRTFLGLKRKDLAQRSGLSYPYISEIENGAKEPSAKALRQIADVLGWSVAELVGAGESLSVSGVVGLAGESGQSSGRGSEDARGFRDSEFAAFLVSTPLPQERKRIPRYSVPDQSSESVVGLTADQLALVQAMINRALADFAEDEMPQLVADEIQRRFAPPAPGGGVRG